MSGCGQFLEVLSANEKSTSMPGHGLKRDFIRVILGHFVKKSSAKIMTECLCLCTKCP